MLNWRIVNRDFQPTLKQWWEARGFPVLPKELLPNRIFVVYDNEMDLYAVPVYVTDSEFVWMGFPTGNPLLHTYEGKDRIEAFQYIMDIIETTMKYEGYTRIITTSMTPSIMSNLETRSFIRTDEGTNFYIKILQ